MAFSIEDVLADPLFAATSPVVLTGEDVLHRPVRWAHASEKIDVAPLLLGGELLMSEGAQIGDTVDPAVIDAYVDGLTDAGIACLAVETSPVLPTVPAPLVRRARLRGLVVVEMRRRVPFVQICQSINMRLSELGHHRLQLADTLSTSLTSVAATAPDLTALARVVASEAHAGVTIVTTDGEVAAAAGHDDDGQEARSTPVACFASALTVAGEDVGTLLLAARVAADIHSVAAALERAPAPLAISLLRLRPPSMRERAGAEIIRLLEDGAGDGADKDLRIEVFLQHVGVPTDGHYLAVAADHGGDARSLAVLRSAVAEAAPDAIRLVRGTSLTAVLPFATSAALEAARADLVTELGAALPDTATICVGVGVAERRLLSREVAIVRSAPAWGGRGRQRVVDAREHQLRRLQLALEPHEAPEEFVDEVLGPLLTAPPELLATLVPYASSWGSKTRTAAALGIGRQALYDRLARIEALIGPLSTTTDRNAAILAAALLTTRTGIARR